MAAPCGRRRPLSCGAIRILLAVAVWPECCLQDEHKRFCFCKMTKTDVRERTLGGRLVDDELAKMDAPCSRRRPLSCGSIRILLAVAVWSECCSRDEHKRFCFCKMTKTTFARERLEGVSSTTSWRRWTLLVADDVLFPVAQSEFF